MLQLDGSCRLRHPTVQPAHAAHAAHRGL